MSVRPTRFGIKGALFCGILWCAFYAAPYLNLFFLLLSFLSVFFFRNFLQAWLNLRVYDTSGRLFDGTNAHGYIDHQVGREDRQWFVEINKPGSEAFVLTAMLAPPARVVASRSSKPHSPRSQASGEQGSM